MSTPVIQLRNLARTYQSGEVEVKAVRGVTLDIERGDFVAIMGASGSGKSTLMNTLGCLDQPTSGEFLLDGIAVADLDRKALAKLRNKKLGFVFQSFNLLARTSAQDNVELPLFYSHPIVTLRERHERARLALEKVGLSDRRDHLPSQLSGGQQQRALLARALAQEADLLLLDEPLNAVDAATRHVVADVLHELHVQGKTIIAATHELENLETEFDAALYLVDGRETHRSEHGEHGSHVRDEAHEA